MSAVTLKGRDTLTGAEVPIGVTVDAMSVTPRAGTGQQAFGRLQQTSSGRAKVEFPGGANVRELWVFCWPLNAPAAAQDNDDLVGVIAIDAPNDAVADSWLVMGSAFSGTTLPVSETGDRNLRVIPLRTWVRIPLNGALQNGSQGGGRVDLKSGDEATLLGWNIVGQ